MKGYSLTELLVVATCIVSLVTLGWIAGGKAYEIIIWTWKQTTNSNPSNIKLPPENSEYGLGPSQPDQ